MIRDRIVCGINDNRIQHRLLQENELTYKQAYDIAQAMETASKCSCVKAGSQCSDCYPGRMGLCRNQKTTSENALLTSNSLTQNHCHSVPEMYSSTQSVSFDSEINTTSEDLSSIVDLPKCKRPRHISRLL